MNTIIDLNVAANVTYNNEASYAISFGANAGNTTANVGAYSSTNITKQTTLNSISSAVRDLLIDVQFSNVGVVDMNYAGTWSNIGILQIAPAAWRVSGIRSVAQYNEAFANVKYTDLTGIVYDVDPNYSYVTTVNDQSGNTRTWTTTVDVNAYVKNMINRTYTTNNITQLFSTSTPLIDDEPDVGQTYTITLNSPIGKFGNSVVYFSSDVYANLANTYTFTGNTTTVNANFGNINFAPANRVSGNSTFTYTQSRDGNSQISVTKNLTANIQNFSPTTNTYTSSTTFAPTFIQTQYSDTIELLVVGGGGGGGSPYGGGGGGGCVKVNSYATSSVWGATPASYTVTVGNGGAGVYRTGNANVQATSGGVSSFIGTSISVSCDGGTGGWANVSPFGARGGNSGIYTGGNGFSSTTFSNFKGGGGGAGFGNNGTSANVNLPGNGGNGTQWSVNNNYYGGGAAGAGEKNGTNLFGNGTSATGGGGFGGFGNFYADGTINSGGGGAGGMSDRSGSFGQGNGAKGVIIIKIS